MSKQVNRTIKSTTYAGLLYGGFIVWLIFLSIFFLYSLAAEVAGPPPNVPDQSSSTSVLSVVPGHASSTSVLSVVPGQASSTCTLSVVHGQASSTGTSSIVPGQASSNETGWCK